MKTFLFIIGLSLTTAGCTKIDDSLLGNTYDGQSDIEQQLSFVED